MLLPNILLNSFLKRLTAQHHPKSCTDRYPDLPSLRVKLLRLEARQNVNQIRVLSLPAEQNLRCRTQPNWRLCASTAWAKGATRISGQLRPVKSPWNSTQNSEALIPPLAPVSIISKALCSGYLAAAVFIHTTIERFFSKHWSPEEKKRRNHTSAARALLDTVVSLTPSLWHSLLSGHQQELKKGTKNRHQWSCSHSQHGPIYFQPQEHAASSPVPDYIKTFSFCSGLLRIH